MHDGIMTNLFQRGFFQLHSGKLSSWKIDCDALTDDDVKTLAELIFTLQEPFGSVEGVPAGGLRLAAALVPYAERYSTIHLIVDDVLTSGGSMERARSAYLASCPADFSVRGAVLFARGACPGWVNALFAMHPFFWPPAVDWPTYPCPATPD